MRCADPFCNRSASDQFHLMLAHKLASGDWLQAFYCSVAHRDRARGKLWQMGVLHEDEGKTQSRAQRGQSRSRARDQDPAAGAGVRDGAGAGRSRGYQPRPRRGY